jgi:hypothetical protein
MPNWHKSPNLVTLISKHNAALFYQLHCWQKNLKVQNLQKCLRQLRITPWLPLKLVCLTESWGLALLS